MREVELAVEADWCRSQAEGTKRRLWSEPLKSLVRTKSVYLPLLQRDVTPRNLCLAPVREVELAVEADWCRSQAEGAKRRLWSVLYLSIYSLNVGKP